jgi:hypothetical protein
MVDNKRKSLNKDLCKDKLESLVEIKGLKYV